MDEKLVELMDEWQVHGPGEWENDQGPKNWFAVSSNNGIVAYFGEEEDACRFKGTEVNRRYEQYLFDSFKSSDYDR
jgi:hypothetical protein